MFRVLPFLQQISDLENRKVQALFLSEGNVCGSVHAEAISTPLSRSTGCRTLWSVLPRLQGITTLENLRIYELLQWLKRWGLSCQKELQHEYLIVRLTLFCSTFLLSWIRYFCENHMKTYELPAMFLCRLYSKSRPACKIQKH